MNEVITCRVSVQRGDLCDIHDAYFDDDNFIECRGAIALRNVRKRMDDENKKKPYLVVSIQYIVPVEDSNIAQTLEELRGYGTAKVIASNVENLTSQEYSRLAFGSDE